MTLTWNQYTHLIMYRLLISYKDLLLIGPHRVKNRMTDVSPFNVIAGNYKITIWYAYQRACRFTYIQINAPRQYKQKHVPRNMTGGGDITCDTHQ